MKKRLLHILTVALVLTATLLCFAVTASAEDIASGTCGENLTWVLTDDGTLTISGTGDMKNYSESSVSPWHNCMDKITNVVIKDGVTSVGDYNFCFRSNSNIKEVLLPDSIKSIGDSAFEGCDALTSIIIPNGVKSIGVSAFYNCSSLTSIAIPKGVTSISEYAFKYCDRLTSVAIPEEVTSIGREAFCGCSNLVSVVISERVTSIGTGAFIGCRKVSIQQVKETSPIKDADFGTSNVFWLDEDGNIVPLTGYCGDNLTWTLTYDETLRIIGNGQMTSADYPKEAISNVVIGKDVTGIHYDTFNGTNSLKTITIEQNKEISPLRDYEFPEGVEVIWKQNEEPTPLGDINGDNKVNIQDVIRLLNHVLFPDLFPLDETMGGEANVDYNHDGKVDSEDVTMLLNYVLFPDLFPLE